MDDRELADRIVALGIGKKKHLVGTEYVESYTLQAQQPVHLDHYFLKHDLIGGADNFVRDWRVVGSLIEKVLATGQGVKIYPDTDVRTIAEDAVNALE